MMVANTLPPTDLSGVGEQVVQLGRGLEESGHEVRVLGRSSTGLRSSKLLFPLTIVVPLLAELRRFKPDVVQVHESDGALGALALKILGPLLLPEPVLSALLQVSYVEEFRAVRAIRYRGRVLGRPSWQEWRFRWFKAPIQIGLGWLTVFLADRVLAPSTTTAEELKRDYRAQDVRVVPNATAVLDRLEASSQPEERRPVALFVGRLRLRKGLEVALEALASMALESDSPHLVIVGDGEHRQRLEQRVAELGLGGRVNFVGRKPKSEVELLMDRARVLVVPSLYEGMPLVIVEAMQRGLPVIASAVSGIPEVVIAGETGWLVPCEDPPALAAALGEAFENGEEARRRGANGRERLAGEYSPARVARLWERVIDLETLGEDSERQGRTTRR